MKNIFSGRRPAACCPEKIVGTGTGITLSLRLFVFLTVLVLTIIFGSIAVLFAGGTFTAGLSESERIIKTEFMDASRNITVDFGQLSLQAIEFSRKLSSSIEQEAIKQGISATSLADSPEKLEGIIGDQFDLSLLSLLISKSSGAFFILNATVNPALEKGYSSRAGLYIKNMEPDLINSISPNITILRGFPGIGRRKTLALHAQWEMEFDVSDAPYYHLPLEAAVRSPHLPLSRLYYWSAPLRLAGVSGTAMLCSVPLVDGKGNVFGVCGLEISEMLFRQSYLPDNALFHRLFCVLSPATGHTLELQGSMFAGGYPVKSIFSAKSPLEVLDRGPSLNTYNTGEKSVSFLGIHAPVQLYPGDSFFSGEQWAIAVMVPKNDVMGPVTRLNMFLFSSFIVLALTGVIVSLVLSQKLFLRPISAGFDIIKSRDLQAAPKTKIPEIDNLISSLAEHNQMLYENIRNKKLSFSALDMFSEKMKELTPAERAVFDFYAEGCTGTEISQKLYVSINTVKTHTRRIYSKLNINTREELILYVRLLEETGWIKG